MASIKLRLPYQKLRKQPPEVDDESAAEEEELQRRARSAAAAGRRWRLRLGRPRRWRRPRLRILPLRQLLARRARLVRASLGRVVRRFKEGRSQLGELFAGNYLFVQVTPATLGASLEKKAPQPGSHGRRAALPAPAPWYCLPGVS